MMLRNLAFVVVLASGIGLAIAVEQSAEWAMDAMF